MTFPWHGRKKPGQARVKTLENFFNISLANPWRETLPKGGLHSRIHHVAKVLGVIQTGHIKSVA
jgi:hypothetical protein